MSVSAGDVFTGIQFIRGVVSKVKDNREDLLRVSNRLQHVLNVLEENQQRDLLRPDEYNDALTAISNLVQRAQRATQKQLKRSLGARTWSRDDIATELKRICDDVDTYLSVHTIKTLDVMHAANDRSLTSLSSNVEMIMVKLAEIDLRLNTPAGPNWSPHILSKANENVRGLNEDEGPKSEVLSAGVVSRGSGVIPPDAPQHRGQGAEPVVHGVDPQIQSLQTLAEAGRTSVQIKSLRDSAGVESDITINVKADATAEDIRLAIESTGFKVPYDFQEDSISITVTDDISEFDTTAPGGLQIAKSMPLIWWWDKYNAYHGVAPATTPGHTLATLDKNDGKTITAADVQFRFHRTLRVPETTRGTMLPLDLGQFPLVPVAKFASRLPDDIRQKGGFLLPMFEREALWISFGGYMFDRDRGPAIKVSVGSVNVITGVAKDTLTPPSHEQDYVVAGLQPWLDGIMTDSGVVRQFVAMEHGQGYTVEEQITGKAEHGGFQFDIFPRRKGLPPFASFYLFDGTDEDAHTRSGESVVEHMTPAELSIPPGRVVGVLPGKSQIIRDTNWTLSGYRRRIKSGSLHAEYFIRGPRDKWLVGSMGLAAGGKISQKIYRDLVSPRMYDEDSGQRFHVHILTPEVWEIVTGVLPKISPITAETYKQHNIPWYSISDNQRPALSTASKDLDNLQSVAQLDEVKKLQTEEPVDPDRPPGCSLHPRSIATSLFRPCSHTACSACLGTALLQGSQCPKCTSRIERFVGMKNPIPKVEVNSSEDGEDAWFVPQMEELALEAVESGKITIIHLDEDRVAPLHRLDRDPTTPSRFER